MKKYLIVTILCILSQQISATTIQISGLEKLSLAKNFDFGYNLNFQDNNCPNYWECIEQGAGGYDTNIPIGSFNQRISELNYKYGAKQYKQDYMRRDSEIILKFSGYKEVCKVILSYKDSVNVALQEDGSCYSN